MRRQGFNEALIFVTVLQYAMFSSKSGFFRLWFGFLVCFAFCICNYWNFYYLSSNNYFRRCWETIGRTSFQGLAGAEGAQLFLKSMTVCFQFPRDTFVLLKFGLIYCCCVIHNVVAFRTLLLKRFLC